MKRHSSHKSSIKIILLCMLPIAVYFGSIRKAIRIWNNLNKNKELVDDMSEHIIVKKSDNENKPVEFINMLFGYISESDCAIISYTPYYTEMTSPLLLYTSEIVVSGSFVDIVGLLQKCELAITQQQSPINRKITSITYRKVTDSYASSYESIETTIVVQQLLMT